MKTRMLRLVAAVLVVLGLTAAMAPWGMGQQRGTAREQMELAQKKRLMAEADRIGMTADQMRKFDAVNNGTPLLYDPARKVTVSWKGNLERGADAVFIKPEAGSGERVSIDYQLGKGSTPGAVRYGEGSRIAWEDLNADGVFDVLVISVKHHDLLNLNQGTYILLEGKWMATTAETGEKLMNVGEERYRFDTTDGRWKKVSGRD